MRWKERSGLTGALDAESVRWYGEGGERGVQDWELMYTCGFIKKKLESTRFILGFRYRIRYRQRE